MSTGRTAAGHPPHRTQPNRYDWLPYREPDNIMTRRRDQGRDTETLLRIGGRSGVDGGAPYRASASARDNAALPRAQPLAILAIQTKTPKRLGLGVSR